MCKDSPLVGRPLWCELQHNQHLDILHHLANTHDYTDCTRHQATPEDSEVETGTQGRVRKRTTFCTLRR